MNSFVGGLAGALGLPGLEEGVDDLEDGALVGVGERFDLLQPLAEPSRAGTVGLGEGLHAEELVGGHLKRAG